MPGIAGRKKLSEAGSALAQAAVNRVRHVSLRVSQILDEKRPGATRIWKPALVLLSGISVASLIGFPGAPQLVSFENPSKPALPAHRTRIRLHR